MSLSPLFLRAGFCLVLAALTSCVGAPNGSSVSGAVTNDLGRGINLGNALESPGTEGSWGVVLHERYFDEIAAAGFETVRIPIRWSDHALRDAPYTIREEFFQRIDWAIDAALSRGLHAVINVHHYVEIMSNPAAQRERFLAFWEQIARRYARQPGELCFEILNEPNGALDAAGWNILLRDALAVIRRSNPDRWVVIGTASWGGLAQLSALDLPEDRRLIVTYHYYEPFHFTHQGASWATGSTAWIGTRWTGTEAERAAVSADFERAAAWARAHGVSLWMGEFGAYSRALMEDRVAWTDWLCREAERLGISWAYWEFCASFGAYDSTRRAWRNDLLRALIPE